MVEWYISLRKKIRNKYQSLKYKLTWFKFLRVYNSPFKTPIIKVYWGPIAHGTPYFFPRKQVKISDKEAYNQAFEKYRYLRSSGQTPSFFKLIEESRKSTKFVNRKFGFNFVELGYKTKWSDTDYRFEHGPAISFVFLRKQLFITWQVPDAEIYWEAWLYYHYHTDRSLSKKDRLALCITNNPLIYSVYKKDNQVEKINYYPKILKEKYALEL